MHPILLKFGPITIYSYGLMVALGFITATILAARTAESFHIPQDKVIALSLWILISGIIGARMLYILLNLRYFVSRPLETIMVWHGGLAFYGGVGTAFIASLVYLKIIKLPIVDTADLIAPYIALGHSIGRIGCFLNSCCFGKATSAFYGIAFADGVTRHPTQLYSSLYLLFLYMFLRVILRYRGFKGQVFFLYLILYPAGRFLIEFLRADNPNVIFNFTLSQVISLAVFIFGICGYWSQHKWNKKR